MSIYGAFLTDIADLLAISISCICLSVLIYVILGKADMAKTMRPPGNERAALDTEKPQKAKFRHTKYRYAGNPYQPLDNQARKDKREWRDACSS